MFSRQISGYFCKPRILPFRSRSARHALDSFSGNTEIKINSQQVQTSDANRSRPTNCSSDKFRGGFRKSNSVWALARRGSGSIGSALSDAWNQMKKIARMLPESNRAIRPDSSLESCLPQPHPQQDGHTRQQEAKNHDAAMVFSDRRFMNSKRHCAPSTKRTSRPIRYSIARGRFHRYFNSCQEFCTRSTDR